MKNYDWEMVRAALQSHMQEIALTEPQAKSSLLAIQTTIDGLPAARRAAVDLSPHTMRVTK